MSLHRVRRDWRRLPWYARYRVGAKWASEARKVMIRATHPHCTVEFQGPARLGPGFTLDIPENGSFIVGPGVDFRMGFKCEISGDGRVSIGAGSIFTSQMLIQCSTSIDIGERCAIGQSCLITDGFHKYRDHTRHFLDQGSDLQPIRIADGVAIAAKATVFADIGKGALIGAHSVVSRPIPAYCVAVGAPARVIEYFGPPDERPPNLDL
jgi:acetyltransferase-like isoleucine patch superfamily enzyme